VLVFFLALVVRIVVDIIIILLLFLLVVVQYISLRADTIIIVISSFVLNKIFYS
jgi:hypothetical protein